MRRISLMLLFVLLCCLLAACGGSATPAPVPDAAVSAVEPAVSASASSGQQAVSLVMNRDSYTLVDAEAGFTVQNDTGATAYVVLFPQLEKQDGETWTLLDTGGVGCSPPLAVEKEWTDCLPFSWYGDRMTPGTYRLSYRVVAEGSNEELYSISATFTLADA